MKLLYGEFSHMRFIKDKYMIFNYSGLKEDLKQLPLFPSNMAYDIINNSLDFDVEYAKFILSNEAAFMAVMEILDILSKDITVYIVINNDPWTNVVFESFTKFLQSRYGITACYVESPEDVECANDTDFDPYMGIRNYDEDRIRYQDMKEYYRIMNGGRPAYE